MDYLVGIIACCSYGINEHFRAFSSQHIVFLGSCRLSICSSTTHRYLYLCFCTVCVCVCVRKREECELIASSGSKFCQFSFNLVESRWFSFSILAVIMLNTLFIAIQTSRYVIAKAGEGSLCARARTHTHTHWKKFHVLLYFTTLKFIMIKL